VVLLAPPVGRCPYRNSSYVVPLVVFKGDVTTTWGRCSASKTARSMGQVLTLTPAREARSEAFLQLLAGLWYDCSRVREGETMREKYEQAMRGAALLVDAMIGLHPSWRLLFSSRSPSLAARRPGVLCWQRDGRAPDASLPHPGVRG
jgi:hypothetical protein